MAENDKGFSFRKLFFRESGPVAEESPVQKPVQTTVPAQDLFIPSTGTLSSSAVPENALVEDFVQRLQNLINQNNQPGFDFLEFTESLFEEKQNPGPEVYKTVFRIAQRFDKSLTPARLVESALYYKNLVQSTADSEIGKGEAKKQGLQTEKDTEKNNLDKSLRDTRAKIQQLTKQIQELQSQDLLLGNQLMAIDQKYTGQFIEIDRKINAIRNAKEQVLVSIVDIEAGIKTNLD